MRVAGTPGGRGGRLPWGPSAQASLARRHCRAAPGTRRAERQHTAAAPRGAEGTAPPRGAGFQRPGLRAPLTRLWSFWASPHPPSQVCAVDAGGRPAAGPPPAGRPRPETLTLLPGLPAGPGGPCTPRGPCPESEGKGSVRVPESQTKAKSCPTPVLPAATPRAATPRTETPLRRAEAGRPRT